MKRFKTAAFALLLVAAPALAGGEAEQKFHQAYALEVVEGDVKGAALVYMELMRDGDATAAIRAESKFRFAVCAVLLGRADEGRAHLTELIEDPDTPDGVRKKAEEYRAAVAGIGVGTELTKKLQSLVFDLGRASPYEKVDAYRDFEIIGKPSLPFLRKLLRHPDRNLRMHAFRLLCRMDEPGMAAYWKPEFGLVRGAFSLDLTPNLTRRPEELARFEKRLLGLGDDAILHLASMSPAPSFSLDFVRALAANEKWRATALKFIGRAGEAGAKHALIGEWITGEDEALSRATSLWLLQYGAKKVPEDLATPPIFRAVVSRLAGPGLSYSPLRVANTARNLQNLARAQSGAELVEALARVIGAGEKWEGSPFLNPVGWGLAQVLAEALDSKLDQDVDLALYSSLLDRCVVVERKLQEEFRKLGHSRMPVPDSAMINHYVNIVKALPEDRATAEVVRLLELHLPGSSGVGHWSALFNPVGSARSVRILVAAIRSVPPVLQGDLVNLLPFVTHRPTAGELARAQAEAVIELTPVLGGGTLKRLLRRYPSMVLALAPAEARENLLALLGLLPRLDGDQRAQVLRVASGSHDSTPGYIGGIVPPVAARVWDQLTPGERRVFLGQMLNALDTHSRGHHDLGEGRAVIGKFLRARYGDLDANLFHLLYPFPDLFPPEEWIPLAPPSTRMATKTSQEENDRIARALSKDVATANAAAIEFIGNYASPALRTEIFERGLALEAGEARRRFVFRLHYRFGGPAGVPAIEKTLAAVLAGESPDLAEVYHLARILLALRPSSKLFPAARLLLGSGNRAQKLTGIHLAGSLGREDLVPDLTKLLDSMDVDLRTKAKEAIDSIRDVVRIKNEQKLREAGMLPK